LSEPASNIKKVETLVSDEKEIVAPASPERVLAAMRAFEWFKCNALTTSDYQEIADRNYIKKSGWMKLALACNISLQKMEERIEQLEKGARAYHYTYRAIAPNGRFADAVGSASTDEREFTHEIHDTRSLAQTRACNRSISNLVGGGEVSAEEMISDATEAMESPPQVSAKDLSLPDQSKGSEPVSPSQDLLTVSGIGRLTLTDGNLKLGILNYFEHEARATVIPEVPILKESGPIKNFLIAMVLDPMKRKHPSFDYEINQSEKGFLSSIVIRGFEKTQLKELCSAIKWSIKHAIRESEGTVKAD